MTGKPEAGAPDVAGPEGTEPGAAEPGVGTKAVRLADIDLSLGRGPARVHVLRGVSLDVAAGEGPICSR